MCVSMLEDRLTRVSATLGTIHAGTLNNLSSSPTAGVRLDSGSAKPGTWTRYIDLAATSTSPFIEHPALSLLADGTADFSGVVSGSAFTASTARFTSVAVGYSDPEGSVSALWADLKFVSGATTAYLTAESSTLTWGTTGGIGATPGGTIEAGAFASTGNNSVGGDLTVSGNANFSGATVMQVPTLTQAEIDALTPANGMIVYNTTLHTFQGRVGGSWDDFDQTPT